MGTQIFQQREAAAHPICPQCHTMMRLRVIEPDPHLDLRADRYTFDCTCGSELTKVSARPHRL
ncbi:MAG TPA: hypothetical protein VFB45_25655 [Pseudolabrys sp.]|nr:hypothetical protein [Pseudolabrys sp.]